MPLVKQPLPLSLNQGINTKVDPKQLPFGQFKNIENVSFDKEGEFSKRFGYEEILGKQIGTSNNQAIIGVAKSKDQLLWVSRDQVYSYSEGSKVFQNEGSYDAIVPESEIVVQNGKEQSELQCIYLENYKIFTYLVAGVLKISIVDNISSSYIIYDIAVPDVASSGSTNSLRLEIFENQLYIFYIDGSAVLKYKVFDLLGYLNRELDFDSGVGKAFTSETTIATLNSDKKYDVAAGSISIIVGYFDNTASELRFALRKIQESSFAVNKDPFTVSVTPNDAIDLHLDLYGKTVVVTANGSGVVKLAILGADATQVKAPTTIEDVTSAGFDSVKNITCSSIDGFDYKLFYQVYQLSPSVYNISTGTTAGSTSATLDYTWSNYHVRGSTYDYTAGTAGTASTLMRGVGLATKSFIQDQNIYINVIRETELYATYYVAKSDGSIQSKISQNTGGSLLNSIRQRAGSSTMFSNYSGTSTNAIYVVPSLSGVSEITNEKFLLNTKIQGVIESGTLGTTNYYSLYGVNSSILDFSNEIVNQTEELAENLHFSGGQIKLYDSNVLVEEGFNYPPEILTVGTLAAGTAGDHTFARPAASDTDTYYYKAHYVWTDAQGNLHRSGLSNQFSWDYAHTASNAYLLTAEVFIPSLPLTQKSNVYVELYRTVKNGTLFYKLNANNNDTKSQTFDPILNQPDADFISFLDKTPDSALTSNEVLYTTGGVLENISPPSCSIIASFKNRLFLSGLENKLELQFSKLLSSKVGVEFNDTLSILVSQVGGDIVALKAMDDKLIILKENALFYLAGDGPNNLGQQDTFIEPQLISSDVGCSVKNSVVLTPAGLFFKSSKGIYLLTRSLALNYIGAPLEDYNNLTITKGDIFPKENEVRFLTSDGAALVYNYYRGFWVLFGNHRGDSSVVIGDNYYYVHKDGNSNKLFKQDSSYSDADSPINIVVETGWINPFVAQGAMRVYRVLLLGKYYSPHRLRVSIAYDFDDNYSQLKLIDVNSYTEVYEFGDPAMLIEPAGVTKGYYGDPGGTTGSYTTAIAYGGKNAQQYQVRVDFDKQKCESFKIKVETVQGSGELGRGVSLSEMTFVVGNKGTEYKIKQGRIFGTS